MGSSASAVESFIERRVDFFGPFFVDNFSMKRLVAVQTAIHHLDQVDLQCVITVKLH